MTHAWVDYPINVTVNQYGEPTHFVWGNVTHRITQIYKRWRPSGDWWQGKGEMGPLCFEVCTNYGLTCIIGNFGEQGWRFRRNFD